MKFIATEEMVEVCNDRRLSGIYVLLPLLLCVFRLSVHGQNCVGTMATNPNPLPTNGSYAPGTVVQICATVSNYTQAGANWMEGFDITMGPGWVANSLTPVTPPNNINGGGGSWIWVPGTFIVSGQSFGPGYFFDLDNNGISYNDFGDAGAGPWTMCVNVTVGSTPGLNLNFTVGPVSDGLAGSWNSNVCDQNLGYNSVPGGTTVGGCSMPTVTVSELNHPICNGQSNGNMMLTGSGGAGSPYTFQVNGSDVILPANNLVAGTYTVTCTDNDGCVSTAQTVEIIDPPSLVVQTSGLTNANCNSETSGAIDVLINGGVSPYVVSIGDINQTGVNSNELITINNLAAGNYEIVVTDFNGCIANSEPLEIDEPEPLTVNIPDPMPICEGALSGTITSAVSGGITPYTYEWSNGVYSPIITDLASGFYSLTVIDSNGCSAMASTTIDEIPLPIASVSPSGEICEGASFALSYSGVNNATYQFQWSPVAGLNNPNIPNPTATPTITTNYSLIVTDENGCQSLPSQTQTVVVHPIVPVPIIENSGPTEFCDGGSVALSVNGNFNYVWSNGETTGSILIENSGSFYVLASDDFGCSSLPSEIINVTEFPLPNADAGTDITICALEPTPLNASGGLLYSWSPTDGLSDPFSPNPTLTLDSPVTLSVTVTDANGCASTDNIAVTVYDAPEVNVSSIGTICSGSSVSLSASGNYNSFQWQDGNGNTIGNLANISVSPLSTTTYTVILSNTLCNTTDEGEIIVAVEEGYSLLLGPDSGFCNGQTLLLDAVVTGIDYLFSWTTQSGNFIGNPQNPQVEINSAGVYTASLTSPSGCLLTDEIIITEYSLPVVDAGPDIELCLNTPTGISASGGVNYQWTPQVGLNNAAISSPQISLSEPAEYTVTATDANGCSSSDVIAFTIRPLPEVTVVQPGIVCPGESVNLIANANYNSFNWSPSATLNDNTLSTVTATPIVSTNYLVTVTDTYCNFTDEAMVGVFTQPAITINLPPDTGFCFGESIVIQTLNPGFGFQTEWSTAGGNIIGDPSLSVIEVDATGEYSILITSSEGCQFTDTINVIEYPLPSVNAGANLELCYDTPTPLNASGAIYYNWNPFNGLSDAQSASPMITATAPATYYLTGVDVNGCTDYDTIEFTIRELPSVSIQPISPICPGGSVILNATGNYNTFIWTPANSLDNASLSSVTATPNSTTDYTVLLTDDFCGFSAIQQVTVNVESGISANAGNDVNICEGENTILQSLTTGSYNSLSWSSPSGSEFTNTASGAILVTETGQYQLTLISNLGCEYSDYVNVTAIPYPEITLPDSIPFCEGDAAVVSVGLGLDAQYWSTGDTTTEVSISVQGIYTVSISNEQCVTQDTFFVYEVIMPDLNLGPDLAICEGDTTTLNAGHPGVWNNGTYGNFLSVTQQGEYSISTELDGCIESDMVYVDVIELPDYSLASPQYGCLGDSVELIPNGAHGEYFEWDDGTTDSSYTAGSPGHYFVVVGNECGTTAADVEVIYQDCEGLVFIPNCFTPNGDGVNDAWIVVGADIKAMDLKVYNRWGQKVFESQEINPIWTGGHLDDEYYIQDGMYFFDLSVMLSSGISIHRNGSFRMIR